MPTESGTCVSIFYSWQSDLPDKANRGLIRKSLGMAAVELNSEDSIDALIDIDEATRNVSGSPNIASTIFDKIKQADIFVCDLTKSAENENCQGERRKYCNPNVAIELGFAIALLGWPRIIIIFKGTLINLAAFS